MPSENTADKSRNLPCAELEKIPVLVEMKSRIPVAAIEHAASCHQCIFWLASMLSINKACLQTTWIRFDRCQRKGIAKTADGIEEIVLWPSRKCFKDLLASAALGQFSAINKLPKETAAELAKIFLSGNMDLILWTAGHVSGCSLCGEYLQELGRLVNKHYERYINDMLQRRPIIPVTEDMARELVVARDRFVMNQTGKPN